MRKGPFRYCLRCKGNNYIRKRKKNYYVFYCRDCKYEVKETKLDYFEEVD